MTPFAVAGHSHSAHSAASGPTRPLTGRISPRLRSAVAACFDEMLDTHPFPQLPTRAQSISAGPGIRTPSNAMDGTATHLPTAVTQSAVEASFVEGEHESASGMSSKDSTPAPRRSKPTKRKASAVPNPAFPKKQDKRAKKPTFVQSLFSILQDPGQAAIISWSECGRHVTVHDIRAFQTHLLPRHYRHSNYASFTRQMSAYGFKKFQAETDRRNWRGKEKGSDTPYYHPFFQKNRADLLHRVIRKATVFEYDVPLAVSALSPDTATGVPLQSAAPSVEHDDPSLKMLAVSSSSMNQASASPQTSQAPALAIEKPVMQGLDIMYAGPFEPAEEIRQMFTPAQEAWTATFGPVTSNERNSSPPVEPSPQESSDTSPEGSTFYDNSIGEFSLGPFYHTYTPPAPLPSLHEKTMGGLLTNIHDAVRNLPQERVTLLKLLHASNRLSLEIAERLQTLPPPWRDPPSMQATSTETVLNNYFATTSQNQPAAGSSLTAFSPFGSTQAVARPPSHAFFTL